MRLTPAGLSGSLTTRSATMQATDLERRGGGGRGGPGRMARLRRQCVVGLGCSSTTQGNNKQAFRRELREVSLLQQQEVVTIPEAAGAARASSESSPCAGHGKAMGRSKSLQITTTLRSPHRQSAKEARLRVLRGQAFKLALVRTHLPWNTQTGCGAKPRPNVRCGGGAHDLGELLLGG